ncbi:MAG: c-type cytochrome [Gammaproteobacteria bacterium]|nr:c-type cytochrome [Gammaproteobacteria bacterium]
MFGAGAAEEAVEEAPVVMAAVSMEDGTALAKKSGCFACHSIDRKILGPGWKDVAAKYAGDKAAGKAHLLNKVAKGGKGVWTEITGGAAMPPYSPRVSDENIEILVDFIIGL